MIKKFTEFDINESNTDAKTVDIKNEYTKIINDPTIKRIDLGAFDDVSDTDITNIQQTYKNSSIMKVDGHYILLVDEHTIIKYNDFEKMNEDGFGDFFKKKLKEPNVTEEINKVLHKKFNGIAGVLNINDGEPTKYDQILYKYDQNGYDSLSESDKKIFNDMVYHAQIIVENDN